MTNCCEHHAITNGCNQGKSCPVRAARDAGACMHQTDDADDHTDMVVYIVLVLAAYAIICGWIGYMWALYGAHVERVLWGLAAKLS